MVKIIIGYVIDNRFIKNILDSNRKNIEESLGEVSKDSYMGLIKSPALMRTITFIRISKNSDQKTTCIQTFENVRGIKKNNIRILL